MSQTDLHIRLIETTDQLVTFCKSAQTAPFLTVDTEFMREKTYFPQLCLVQVGTETEAVVVDALASGIELQSLWDLLLTTPMPKVFHAASQDLEIFARLAGDLPAPLFDTQIAAMVVGIGDQVGYDKLVKETLGVSIDKSSRYSDWSVRPLAKRQIDYAAGDVTYLRGVYRKLMALLEQQDRQAWVDEEMAKIAVLSKYQNDPAQAYKRLKVRTDKAKFIAVLQQLASWRELDAQNRDVPRGRIMRDDTLLDLASAEPTTVEDLKKIRGVSDKLAEGKIGKEIIRAVNLGLATPKDQIVITKRRPALTDEETAKLSLLKMLLSVKAAEAGTAARMLASSQDLEELARTPLDLWQEKDIPCLSGWRKGLYGDAAKALVQGKLWIGFENGSVQVRDSSQ